jgi:MoaA/NifB/PqqE/SkfB family radical SAM enzyme
MFKITSRWPHQTSTKVEWNIGKRCNYDCSYCPSEIHDNRSSHTNINILKSTVDKLAEIGKPLRLSFTGGEPCVHPKFDELIDYAQQKATSWISVTTNGTRPSDFYVKLPVHQYVFSLHFEYDWESILKKILYVNNTCDIKLVVHVMAHHDHMDSVKIVTQKLHDNNIPYAIRRIRWTTGDHDVFDDNKYKPNDLAWILANDASAAKNCIIDDSKMYHANDIIKLHLNQFKEWSCHAGIESLMINWDGDVSRATCRVGGSLGNIYTKSFSIPNAPIICTRNFCTCAADIPITKVAC